MAGKWEDNPVTDFKFGLVHAPMTPFSGGNVDYECYGKLLDFHLRNDAEGLAMPMHTGESVSLTVEERKILVEFAIRHVGNRVPLIVNVSEAGTAIAMSLAAHAKQCGVSAIIASVPYYWTPPQPMLVEHFAAIGKAATLPFFVLNSPREMSNVEFTSNSVVDLLGRLPNFAGLIDVSLDWQYMVEIVTVARAVRPDFQFVSGTEYMISACAIGATGILSSLASISPRLVSALYRSCRRESYKEAYSLQEDAVILFQSLRDTGVSGLKAAAACMFGRDCGNPRPPLPKLDARTTQALVEKLGAVHRIKAEPHGWSPTPTLWCHEDSAA
jgi:4-hydroxy-tetrahydrodipicolinate synthase